MMGDGGRGGQEWLALGGRGKLRLGFYQGGVGEGNDEGGREMAVALQALGSRLGRLRGKEIDGFGDEEG